MAKEQIAPLLTEEFLFDLYKTAFEVKPIASAVVRHVTQKHLPDRDFGDIHRMFSTYYNQEHNIPQFSTIVQSLSNRRSAVQLLNDIATEGQVLNEKTALTQLEQYLRQTRFLQCYHEIGSSYNTKGYNACEATIMEYAAWASAFTLGEAEFYNVIEGMEEAYEKNGVRKDSVNAKPITRFYIDELDARNRGQNLRTQLTCFLAQTGVGKSHIARYIGKCACQEDGLNVLHFQLEGSRDEVVNAYSASFIQMSTQSFEQCSIPYDTIKELAEELKSCSGRVYVKAFTRFDKRCTVKDIKNDIDRLIKVHATKPDIIIVDSMDLLEPTNAQFSAKNEARMKHIQVANELKDLAAEENVWMVVTYQSTIENPDWTNDEKNVLTTYNTAEAKGINRPLTHLITLNQSQREEGEGTMRLYVAKSRFFKKGSPFRIATDYEHEQFYDRQRSLNLQKL